MDETRPWLPDGAEDILGQDRQVVAMIRTLELMPPGGMIGVAGPGGGGRDLFLRRAAWMISEGRTRLKLRNNAALYPSPVWLEPWLLAPGTHPLAGLANAALRASSGTQSGASGAIELINKLNRLGDLNSPGSMRPGSAPSLSRMGDSFATLFSSIKGGRPGRVVVLITGMERAPPELRWVLLDGLRVLRRAEVNASIIISLDRDSTHEAVRCFEPRASIGRLDAIIDDKLDLVVTVRGLGVRRISTLLRRYLGEAEPLLRSSFGPEALNRLSLAAAHEPLGSPQFLRRLANRAILLAEFVQELRAMQDLSEPQWAWVIISQRWPDLRSYMLTTARWAELRQTLQWLLKKDRDSREMVRSPLVQRLEDDPQLFRYLRQHAEGFRSDADGLLRAEALLQDAGI
ncbi:MAG: hypothetical protein ACI8S6_002205 [Myxococcota bacterium]|jgi:hypothetical protein